MQALEKLTVAYLALQEHAEKLQADKDAMFFENQTLQAKYKKAKEKNAFLQADRNKWFDAYDELEASNEKATVGQANEMRNLKECIDELEGQCVELQAKLDQLQPAPKHKINGTKKAPICDKYSGGIGAEGNEAEKRVCRANFKDSETPSDTVLILHYGVHFTNWVVSNDRKLVLSQDISQAKQFASHDEIDAFLHGQPKTNFITYFFNPKTGYFGTSPEQPAAEKTPQLYHTIYDNPA